MPATYLSIVNDAIDESGVDLAQYETDGSDFTTSTEAMLVHFKKWVARAWKTVQQTAFDWEFLNNQGIVTLNPGLMFYTRGNIVGELSASIDIYGTDGTILYSAVPVTHYKDLTYTQFSDTVDKSFGYLDLHATNDEPLTNLSFKAGGDYFLLEGRATQYSVGPQLPHFFDKGVFPGNSMAILAIKDFNEIGETRYVISSGVTLVSVTPDTDSSSKGSQGFVFTCDSADMLAAYNDPKWAFYFYLDASYLSNPQNPDPAGLIAAIEYTDPFATIVKDTIGTKAVLHSWKSFNFMEEQADDDYAGELSEIDNDSFQLIDNASPSASSSYPLTFVPWDVYSTHSDWLCSVPGTPTYITEDNTGRWRLYPQPDRPVTLKFSYSRVPQTLTNYNDTLKGLPEDFTDMVMWLAIRMYGEFDEQPAIQRRAERYYKDMLQRVMIKYRPKFRLAPKRLY